MALVIPNAGEADALNYYTNKSSPQNLVLRLYTNNYTPVNSSIASDFTEASGGAYAAITLTGSSWSITPGSPSSATCAQQTFSCDGSGGVQSCYGYFLTRASSGVIAHAERFTNGPYSFANNGDAIKITPSITLASNTSD